MKLALKLLGIAIAALFLGMGSALLVVRGGLGGGIEVGPWQTSTIIGSAEADPYTRARVATAGLLALNRSETIYFNATRDDVGDRLRATCTYKIVGTDPPARWWSITLYAGDHYLVANPEDRYSYGGNNVAREDDGSFIIAVGPEKTGGNWIPTGNGQTDDTFSLTLRLYNPEPAAARDPSGVVLPHIAKEACTR
ncbi:protein of unknown function DUF1214 [Parvibaculum lavamentivorans DS-1]|uniref:DUF1214 domain-containing protein n=1 Tax=Parvibaculum lavamentivorans (strain DS-1 / DSM 13023 / NCIMB 13966) TaxID=402881 RepID=A7HRI5_PARL1|nr:DUF1214 domain-containing protein [Parvibaculum lavamentivorans]ABS62518.1 protein of unknown function DUF1214 [Parvibaculum lavamentivorans DS-1]